jgi:hypothetical protein
VAEYDRGFIVDCLDLNTVDVVESGDDDDK